MKRRIFAVILTAVIVFLSSVSTYAGYDVCNHEEDDKQVCGRIMMKFIILKMKQQILH